jgi:hypothetical protein
LKQLGYPVALDTAGRLADGHRIPDQPSYVLTSASGRIVWQHDGWLPVPGRDGRSPQAWHAAQSPTVAPGWPLTAARVA